MSQSQHQHSLISTPYTDIKPTWGGSYTFIYLIRHCHPNYEQKEITGDKHMPLSDLGKQQRTFLTNWLITKQIDYLYASEYTRAQETAVDYASHVHKRVHIEPGLNEINWQQWYKVKYFNMSEKTRRTRLKKYETLDKKLDWHQARARKVIARICDKHQGKTIAVFCHGNKIRAMLTGILSSDIIGFLSMEIYQSSVSKLAIDQNGFIKINYINSIRHLPHKPDENLFRAAINQ